ncbi:MAG: flavodoxin family protein [Candidatus Thorarchaeota archaeon]
MRILCLSSSNVLHRKENSASTKICELIGKIISEKDSSIGVEILKLQDYNFSPCIFCGKCQDSIECPYDIAINKIFLEFVQSDGIFLVVPHYSIIPAKLTIILEKLNQFYYTQWLKNPDQDYPLKNKKIALVVHGGGDTTSYEHYREYLLKPLNYLFQSLGFTILGKKDQPFPLGLTLGITKMTKSDTSIFPDMVHDWSAIEEILKPYVDYFLRRLE